MAWCQLPSCHRVDVAFKMFLAGSCPSGLPYLPSVELFLLPNLNVQSSCPCENSLALPSSEPGAGTAGTSKWVT